MRYKLITTKVVKNIKRRHHFEKIYQYDINGMLISCVYNNGLDIPPKSLYIYIGFKLSNVVTHSHLYNVSYENDKIISISNENQIRINVIKYNNDQLDTYIKGGNIHVIYENNIPIKLRGISFYDINHTHIKTLNYGCIDNTIQYIL